jgi:hypothetical protein
MYDPLSLKNLSLYACNNAVWVSIVDHIGYLNEITPSRPRGGSKSKSGASTQDDTFPRLAQLRTGFVGLVGHWRIWR